MFGPRYLSPEPTCKGLQGRSGQEPRGRATRKDSLSPAVSRHRRKDAPVLGPSPHSPVDTGVRTRRCSGQSATSQATSPSPHSARVLYMRNELKRYARILSRGHRRHKQGPTRHQALTPSNAPGQCEVSATTHVAPGKWRCTFRTRNKGPWV